MTHKLRGSYKILRYIALYKNLNKVMKSYTYVEHDRCCTLKIRYNAQLSFFYTHVKGGDCWSQIGFDNWVSTHITNFHVEAEYTTHVELQYVSSMINVSSDFRCRVNHMCRVTIGVEQWMDAKQDRVAIRVEQAKILYVLNISNLVRVE